jgi:hypothetical protein
VKEALVHERDTGFVEGDEFPYYLGDALGEEASAYF